MTAANDDDPSLMQLRQLYRHALVTLGGADAAFAEEIPLTVLSGMFGPRLRQAVMTLSFWPTVHAASSAMLQRLPLEAEVAGLFEQLEPLVQAHDAAFTDAMILGFMTDRSMRVGGNAYNRALLQLSFRVTSVWTTSHASFMLVRDAAQLLALVEMMVASHGAGIADLYEDVAGGRNAHRIEAYIDLLAQVRKLVEGLPEIQDPTASIEWLRDNMEKQLAGWRLTIDGTIIKRA